MKLAGHLLIGFSQAWTTKGHIQGSLCAAEAGLGWRRALDVARAAHLGGLIATCPRIKSMIRTGAVAGLLPAALLQHRFDALAVAAETAYLESLDETEKVRAEDFLRCA